MLLAALMLSVLAFRLWGQETDQAPSGAAAALQDTPRIARRKSAPPAQAPAPLPAFGGYPCISSDCSEDKAGFRWAEDNAIADPDDCTGKTAAFIEGCRVFAQRAPHRAITRSYDPRR